MQDLEPHTNYVVELRAFTSIGEGRPVRIAAQTGESEWMCVACMHANMVYGWDMLLETE